MKRLTTEIFINRCKEIHFDKYDYSKANYKTNAIGVIIICRKHGPFIQSPGHHMRGIGCPKCKSVRIGNALRKSIGQFVKDAKIIHKDLYDYSQFQYVNAFTKGIILCSIHNEFYQSPAGHLKGQGCPKCTHIISNPESEFLNFLNIKDRQIKIGRYSVDGYDKNTNTIYEFLGDYWHGNLKNKRFNSKNLHPIHKITFKELEKRTFKKLKKLKFLQYNVKFIWELDWKLFKKGINATPNIQTL